METTTNPMQQLIIKCWTDEEFKNKLLADPVPVLQAEGIQIPEGVSVNVLENTPNRFHLVIPVQPSGLTDEEMATVIGGVGLHGDDLTLSATTCLLSSTVCSLSRTSCL